MAPRKRSKSLYVEKMEPKLSEDESSAEEDNENQEDCNFNDEDTYSAEDDMVLLRGVWTQLPKKDKMSFNDRIARINWNAISFKNQSPSHVKARFLEIISNVRHFRLLAEILKDVEKISRSKLNLPRRPLAPHLLFLEENKSLLKMKADTLKEKGNMTKIAASMYANLSKEEKEYYKNKSERIRTDYKDVISKFNLDESVLQRMRRKKKGKEPVEQDNVGYYYWKQQNAIDNDMNFTEAKKSFNALDNKQRLKWILQYLGVKKKEKLNLNQFLKAKTVLSKDEMNLINEYEGRPKKATTYAIFIKEYKNSQEEHNMSAPEIFKTAAKKWQSLSDNEKERYKKKSAEILRRYNTDFPLFIQSLPEDRRTFEALQFKKKVVANPNNSRKLDGNLPSGSDEMEDVASISSINSPSKKLIASKSIQEQNNEKNKIDSQVKKAQGKRKFSQEEEEDEEEVAPLPTKNKRRNLKETIKEEEVPTLSPTNKSKSKKKDKTLQVQNENSAQVVIQQNRKSPQKYKSPPSFLTKRPPSSLHKFFLDEIYDGPPEVAKETFRSLTRKEKNKLGRKLEKIKQKYLSELETYAKDLPKEERRRFMEANLNSGEDEDSSDWGSSDSSESS